MPTPIQDFLLDPDQTARRNELRTFIGPEAEQFLKTYDGMLARARQIPGQPKARRVPGFVPLAFFLGPCWFFYRKLWLWAGGISAAMAAITFIPLPLSRLGVPIGLAMGMMARTIYLEHAIKQITQLRGPAPIADPSLLAQAGGVSKTAGWISGAIMGLLIAASLAAIWIIYQHGDLDALDLR